MTIAPGTTRVVSRSDDGFVFQAIEYPSRAIRVAINTQQDPEARPLLQRLFDTISTNADREAVDFLRKVISP